MTESIDMLKPKFANVPTFPPFPGSEPMTAMACGCGCSEVFDMAHACSVDSAEQTADAENYVRSAHAYVYRGTGGVTRGDVERIGSCCCGTVDEWPVMGRKRARSIRLEVEVPCKADVGVPWRVASRMGVGAQWLQGWGVVAVDFRS